MERYKRFRKIVTLLVALFILDAVLLIVMMPAYSPLFVAVMAVQAIVITFFAVLSRGLIKEVEEMERADDERRMRERAEQRNLKNNQ